VEPGRRRRRHRAMRRSQYSNRGPSALRLRETSRAPYGGVEYGGLPVRLAASSNLLRRRIIQNRRSADDGSPPLGHSRHPAPDLRADSAIPEIPVDGEALA
jgi:hypothetical protein